MTRSYFICRNRDRSRSGDHRSHTLRRMYSPYVPLKSWTLAPSHLVYLGAQYTLIRVSLSATDPVHPLLFPQTTHTHALYSSNIWSETTTMMCERVCLSAMRAWDVDRAAPATKAQASLPRTRHLPYGRSAWTARPAFGSARRSWQSWGRRRRGRRDGPAQQSS